MSSGHVLPEVVQGSSLERQFSHFSPFDIGSHWLKLINHWCSINAFACWKADDTEYFNSVLVALVPWMLKWERTHNNYTCFNGFRYNRAEQIMVTGGLDGAYQQVIPYTTGPMSCTKHKWDISRFNKFSSSCWGKICIRDVFSSIFHA